MNSHSFTCEAILQFPALAKADGLIKSKEDLMDVLLKKRHLFNMEMMQKCLSFEDTIKMLTSEIESKNKKRKREEGEEN